ncbi:hypothetical protein, partial [Citrobacter freundii]|uniref:hypothetical protein n=1 Tax=Citrobacter freundii TaxID=546 RepID=UPI00207C7A93
DDKGWDARKRAYCLKIQPATGSFARNLIYSTKPQPYYEEGASPWVPIFFIKHTMSLKLIFEIPMSPAEILTNSSLPNGKYNELHNYCQARYGTKLPECRKQIAKKLIDNGFYIPK